MVGSGMIGAAGATQYTMANQSMINDGQNNPGDSSMMMGADYAGTRMLNEY